MGSNKRPPPKTTSSHPRKRCKMAYKGHPLGPRRLSLPSPQRTTRLSSRSGQQDLPDVANLPTFERNREKTPSDTSTESDLSSSPPSEVFDSLTLQEIAEEAVSDGTLSAPVADDDDLTPDDVKSEEDTWAANRSLAIAEALADDDDTMARDALQALADAITSDDFLASDYEESDDDDDSPCLPILNGVYWDMELDCEARPMSKESSQTIYPGVLGKKTKCICGNLNGGLRVPRRNAKKHHYQGPNFVFNEGLGAFVSEKTNLSTPFKSLPVTLPNGKPKVLYVPFNYTMADYLAGVEIPKLSSERTVPQCAHFPVTGLSDYNVPFVKGRIAKRNPNLQCTTSRVQDQARYLCLIEDEVREDGTIRRRMNVHAPPADWNDPNTISCLNRWRAQFRSRKLHVTSRAARTKWSTEAVDWMIERLARDPDVYRAKLARQVTKKFKVERTEHAVSCAIDNHNLRARAEALRTKWETEGMDDMFGDEADMDVDDKNLERDDDETLSDLTDLSESDDAEDVDDAKNVDYVEDVDNAEDVEDVEDVDAVDDTPVRPKLVPKLNRAQLSTKKRESFMFETKMMDWFL